MIMNRKIYFLILFSLVQFFMAQKSMKLPENAFFYMEINGKIINQKLDWEKLNPMIEGVTKDKKLKSSWNDFSKTGIKYDGKQYHFAQVNDSVRSYTAHFVLDNHQKFLEFVNSTKKEGLETTRKNKYSFVGLDENTFVAWNESHAVLKVLYYSKPDVWEADSVVAIVDSAAAVRDSVYIESPIEAEIDSAKFDYKAEIEYLKEDLNYYEQTVKENNAEIKRIKEEIKHLEKYHRYPVRKEEKPDKENSEDAATETKPSESEDAESPDYTFDNDAYKKEMDSINIAQYKINLQLAAQYFDEYFNSDLQIEVPRQKLDLRDVNSDLFAYTDYQNMMKSFYFPGKISSYNRWQDLMQNMYDSDVAYNLFFDKDKVRLVSSYRHMNPEIQKSFAEAYNGRKNRKLTRLLSEKSIGYYAFNVNGYKTFDLLYTLLNNTGDEKYQKEFSVMVETLKIALDEKAISKIAPGNGIFILNTLGSKKVTYTDYEYDEEYNEKEIEKTKDVVVPDFTLAFATENEGYWKRLFEAIAGNKEFSEEIVKKGDLYSIKQKENSALDQLFFTVKEGIVYLTTSEENIGEKPQTNTTRKWAKEIHKTSMNGKLDVVRFAEGFANEITSEEDREFYNFFRKNAGDLTYKLETKSDRINSEFNYQTRGTSDNSLMYFFDLLEEVYKMNSKTRKTTVSF